MGKIIAFLNFVPSAATSIVMPLTLSDIRATSFQEIYSLALRYISRCISSAFCVLRLILLYHNSKIWYIDRHDQHIKIVKMRSRYKRVLYSVLDAFLCDRDITRQVRAFTLLAWHSARFIVELKQAKQLLTCRGQFFELTDDVLRAISKTNFILSISLSRYTPFARSKSCKNDLKSEIASPSIKQ